MAKNNASRHFPQDFFNKKNRQEDASQYQDGGAVGRGALEITQNHTVDQTAAHNITSSNQFNDTFSNTFNPQREPKNKGESQKLAENFAGNSMVAQKPSLTIDYGSANKSHKKDLENQPA